MSGRVRATLPAIDDANLGGILHGLRESIETARLAGNVGAANFYDTLAALVDNERAQREGKSIPIDDALLLARARALHNGELLALAEHTSFKTPPGVPASCVAFLRAVGDFLTDECRHRVGL